MLSIQSQFSEHFSSLIFKDGKVIIDNKTLDVQIDKVKKGQYILRTDNKTYEIYLVKQEDEKHMTLMVNGEKYHLNIKDQYDELLKKLGLANMLNKKVAELKAPMPGLVLNVHVSEGDVVKKGDALLVLEAMKMENNIKAPADAVVKKIHVTKGMAVEKNQLLIAFD